MCETDFRSEVIHIFFKLIHTILQVKQFYQTVQKKILLLKLLLYKQINESQKLNR